MTRLVALGFLCFLTCPALARLQNNNKAAVAMFQSRYDGLTQAYLAKDVAAAGSYLAPDYSSGDFRRELDKKKTLDELRHAKGRFKTTSRKVISVIVNGSRATVMAESITEGHMADQKGDHLYSIKAQTMDTWVHNAQWQLLHSRVTRKALTKDGKPIAPRQPGG